VRLGWTKGHDAEAGGPQRPGDRRSLDPRRTVRHGKRFLRRGRDPPNRGGDREAGGIDPGWEWRERRGEGGPPERTPHDREGQGLGGGLDFHQREFAPFDAVPEDALDRDAPRGK
jgi:hypothetical protein